MMRGHKDETVLHGAGKQKIICKTLSRAKDTRQSKDGPPGPHTTQLAPVLGLGPGICCSLEATNEGFSTIWPSTLVPTHTIRVLRLSHALWLLFWVSRLPTAGPCPLLDVYHSSRALCHQPLPQKSSDCKFYVLCPFYVRTIVLTRDLPGPQGLLCAQPCSVVNGTDVSNIA